MTLEIKKANLFCISFHLVVCFHHHVCCMRGIVIRVFCNVRSFRRPVDLSQPMGSLTHGDPRSISVVRPLTPSPPSPCSLSSASRGHLSDALMNTHTHRCSMVRCESRTKRRGRAERSRRTTDGRCTARLDCCSRPLSCVSSRSSSYTHMYTQQASGTPRSKPYDGGSK
jgi:hypothetical protein